MSEWGDGEKRRALTTDVGAFFVGELGEGVGKWVYEYFCPELAF